MIKIPTLFRTYFWLIDTFNRVGRASLDEINERWVNTEMSGGSPMHRNTFKRHIESIEEMFDLFVVYDARSHKYYMENHSALRQNSLKRWLLSTMAVAGVVRESRSLQDRIILENVPSGDLFLAEVTHAMENARTLKIGYQKFIDAEPYECELEPYCLKLFRQRWYLLAHRTDRSYLAIYALDRMTKVETTKTVFHIPDDFDSPEFFKYMFGVFQPKEGEKPVRVVIRTYSGEWNYLRTLPLHHSQKELPRGGGEVDAIDFSYNLCLTYDLKLELLSRGAHIEVLEPKELREDMRQMTKEAAQRYE